MGAQILHQIQSSMSSRAVLLCLLFTCCQLVAAFNSPAARVPASLSASSSVLKAAGVHRLQQHRAVTPRPPLRMIEMDTNTITVLALMVAGIGGGVGLLAFIESAGERTMERGTVSGELQSKLEGKFMEDTELVDSSIDDLISKLEKAQSADSKDEEKPTTEAKTPADDGW